MEVLRLRMRRLGHFFEGWGGGANEEFYVLVVLVLNFKKKT